MTQVLHAVGSPSLGGAELFFARLVNGLHAQGTDVAALTRAGSGVAEQIHPGVQCLHLPVRNMLDYYSRWRISSVVADLNTASRQLVPLALSVFLLSSPLAMAEEAHHPEQAGGGMSSAASAGAPSTEAPGETAAGSDPGATKGPGMMPSGMSGQGGGMMMPGMMAGMQGGGMMGMGGMMGRGAMMDGRMMGCMHGMGGGMMRNRMMGGQGMMQMHQQVITRLDLLDARLAKIEALFGRLMQR